MAGRTARVQKKIARREFPRLLDKVRHPAWPRFLDEALNLTEMFVHHEDVRRTGTAWQPRTLSPSLQDALWRQVRRRAPLVLRRFPATVKIGSVTAGKGGPEVTLTGEPSELLIFLFGRQAQALATVDGPPELAERLRKARLGI